MDIGVPVEGRGRWEGGNAAFLPESPPPRRFQDPPRLSPSSSRLSLGPEPPLPLLPPAGARGAGRAAGAGRRALIGPKLAARTRARARSPEQG